MNELTTATMTDPYGKTSACIQFTIDDTSDPFVLNDIMVVGQQYTFSLWLMSADHGVISVSDTSFAIDNSWYKYFVTFDASHTELTLNFDLPGVYYVYHPQLEIGNKVTDWGIAPEDTSEGLASATQKSQDAQQAAEDTIEQLRYTESRIQQLADSISMMVRSGTAGSLVKQDASGLYYFDISDIETNISENSSGLADLYGVVLDANGQIDVLNSTAEALQKRTEYVKSYTDENDQPCLELGEGDSTFKVFITNTELRFVEGSSVPAYISNQKLYIEKAEILNELQFGDFVWKIRENGNMGLVWKGVGS